MPRCEDRKLESYFTCTHTRNNTKDGYRACNNFVLSFLTKKLFAIIKGREQLMSPDDDPPHSEQLKKRMPIRCVLPRQMGLVLETKKIN